MKEQQYQMLVSQIASLIEGETDEIAVMSNVAAAIHQEMHFWWTGFYRVAGEELLLGPFQAQPGNVVRRLSCPMWSSFLGISPVVVHPARRLSCRCSTKKVISRPCSTSTASIWRPSTTSTATISKRSAN